MLFLTREEGLLSAVVHGAQKSNTSSRLLSSPFRRIRAHFYHDPVKQTWKAQDLEEVDLLESLAQNWDKYATACLWAETVIKSWGESPNDVYELMSPFLTLLATLDSQWVQPLRIQFLWRYLNIMGSLPDLSKIDSRKSFLLRELDLNYLKDSLFLPHTQSWELSPSDGHWETLETETLKLVERALGKGLNSIASLLLVSQE